MRDNLNVYGSVGCFHQLRRLTPPKPAPSGKPYKYECERCGALLKIASGRVLPTKKLEETTF
jgi:hypothetical protein